MDFGQKKDKPVTIVNVVTTPTDLKTHIDENAIYSLSDAKKAQLISLFNTLMYHLGAFDNQVKEDEPTENKPATRQKN